MSTVNNQSSNYRSVTPSYNSSVAVTPRSIQSIYTIDNIPITPNPFVDKSITDYLQLLASGFYAARGNLSNVVFEYTGTQMITAGRVLNSTWTPSAGLLWDASSPGHTYLIQASNQLNFPLFGTVDDTGHFYGGITADVDLTAYLNNTSAANYYAAGNLCGLVDVQPYNQTNVVSCKLNAQIAGNVTHAAGPPITYKLDKGSRIVGSIISPNNNGALLNYGVKCVSYSVGNGGLYDFSNQINFQDQFVQTALNSLVESGLANAPINRLSARYVFTF